MTSPKHKILYVVTEDWYFWSHRLPTARAAKQLGCEIVVVTGVGSHQRQIEALGFKVIPLNFDRSGFNVLRDTGTLLRLIGIYRTERPDIVHHVALKPILYGSIAARLAGIRSVVNNFAGLGLMFSSGSAKVTWARPLITAVFRWLFRHPSVELLFQNQDDRITFANLSLGSPERRHLVRGSGVDTDAHPCQPEAKGPVIAALVSRMLWDKGVGETVEAAGILKRKGVPVKIRLVGSPDPKNPKSISTEQLQRWADEGTVSWTPHTSDVPAVWRDAHIGILPSYYGEGLPKSLLEAASAGRPLIATDLPGCREIVSHEDNGLLVPPGDPMALAAAIERLVNDPVERRAFGAQARKVAVEEFCEEVIIKGITDLYCTMLGRS